MLIKYVLAFVMSSVLISSAMAAGSSSSSTQSKAGNYENGVKAVKSANYKEAIKLFNKVVAAKPTDADAWNYLGFSNRKLNKFDLALSAYQKALAIDPAPASCWLPARWMWPPTGRTRWTRLAS